MSREVDLPADPARAADAAALLKENVGDNPEWFADLAWQWARQVTDDEQRARDAYFAVLAAGGYSLSADDNEQPEPEPEPQPEPGEQEPEHEAPAEPDPAPEPDPASEPEPQPEPGDKGESLAPAPLPADVAQRAQVLAREAERAGARIAGPIPRWDPAEEPVIAGRVEAVDHADLRQRGGAVRILLLRTEAGLVEVWLGHQQSAALLREMEAEHGRVLAAGDLFAIAAKGRQRIGASRSPSRLFSLAVNWAGEHP